MKLSISTSSLEQAIAEKNIEKVKSIVAENDIDYSVVDIVFKQPTIDFGILLFLIKHADIPSAIDSRATIVSDIKKSINLDKRLIKYKEIQQLLETIDVVDAHWLSYSNTEAVIITLGKNKEHVIKYATRYTPGIKLGRLCVEWHYKGEKKTVFDISKKEYIDFDYNAAFDELIKALLLETLELTNKELFTLFSYLWSRQVQKELIPVEYASANCKKWKEYVAVDLLRKASDWVEIDKKIATGKLTQHWKDQAIAHDMQIITFLNKSSHYGEVAFAFLQILSCPEYPEKIITYTANILSDGQDITDWHRYFKEPIADYLCSKILPVAEKILERNYDGW